MSLSVCVCARVCECVCVCVSVCVHGSDGYSNCIGLVRKVARFISVNVSRNQYVAHFSFLLCDGYLRDPLASERRDKR